MVAVPTSAVQTLGTRSYVLEVLDKGELTRKVIKVGMVGDTYTQVLSGLTPGQSVVLADYAEPVPSSNTDTNALGWRWAASAAGGGVGSSAAGRHLRGERASRGGVGGGTAAVLGERAGVEPPARSGAGPARHTAPSSTVAPWRRSASTR